MSRILKGASLLAILAGLVGCGADKSVEMRENPKKAVVSKEELKARKNKPVQVYGGGNTTQSTKVNK